MIEPQTESKQSTVYILLIMLIVGLQGYGQTWADTLDNYARLSYLPASRYMWTWQDAALHQVELVCAVSSENLSKVPVLA